VRLAQAIDAARKDAAEQIVKFRSTVPGVDVQLVDYFDELRFDLFLDVLLFFDKKKKTNSKIPRFETAMDGCKVLKAWIAAMFRQLGTIVQRNPAVFKSKARLVQLGLDPANGSKGGVDCVVSYADGTLSIVQNMDSAAKPDATVSQRVDGVLDVTMANLQGEVTVEMATRSKALSTALRIPNLAVNLDFAFESDPVFNALPPQNKAAKIKRLRAHVEGTLDALIKCGPEACVGLVAVLACCDCSNSIADVFSGATDADHYLTVLDADGLLRVTINLESVDKALGRLHHKIEQQLALHRARQDKYHDGPEVFDWESLQSCGQLLNDSILIAFEASLSHSKESVRCFAKALEDSRSQSPAGREEIEKLQHLVVRMDRNQGAPWVIVLENNDTTLALCLSLSFVKDKIRLEQLEWKEALEWTLHYCTVEVEKHHAQARIALAEAALKKTFGGAIKVSLKKNKRSCLFNTRFFVQITIDWPVYIDQQEFLELGAAGCRDCIRRLSIDLLNAVVKGVSSISSHPIGAKVFRKIFSFF
jgi:hypothetical protein